ncbi:hypothetical protein TYRP_020662 [Tyrophagus putrescentiae]|nr:hypothetical protein TYRP_020662 [Tyrophagus putrescentiae]
MPRSPRSVPLNFSGAPAFLLFCVTLALTEDLDFCHKIWPQWLLLLPVPCCNGNIVDLCAIFGAQLFPPPPPPHELLSPVLTLTGDIVRALQIEEEGRGGEEENGEGAMDDCYYYTRQ